MVLPLVQAWGTLAMMLTQTHPPQPFCILWLANTGPFVPSNSGCIDAASTCPESEGSTQQGSLARQDVAPVSTQGSCYVELPSFLPSCTAQGGCQVHSQLPESGHWNGQFNSRLLLGGQFISRLLVEGQFISRLLLRGWLISGFLCFSWNEKDSQLLCLGTL